MRIPIVGAVFLAVFVFGQETKVYKMGEAVTSPAVLYKTDPPYSEEARLAKVIATVIVQLVVTPQGKTVDFKILQSAGFGLDEQSIASVKQWRFKPGTKDGAPVFVEVNVKVNFSNFDPNAGASSLLFDLAAGETRPVLIEGTAPTLPVDSAGQRLEAKLTVSNTGEVKLVEQVSGSGPWIEDAVAKIKRWRFTPALKNAAPVSVKGVYSLVPNATVSPPPAPPESPTAAIHKPETQATPVPSP